MSTAPPLRDQTDEEVDEDSPEFAALFGAFFEWMVGQGYSDDKRCDPGREVGEMLLGAFRSELAQQNPLLLSDVESQQPETVWDTLMYKWLDGDTE